MNKATRFHMSLPCKDINQSRKFYEKELNLKIGRSAYSWFDVDLFGNQITYTQDDMSSIKTKDYSFEEVRIPSFHFGVILENKEWQMWFDKFKNSDFFAIGSTNFLVDKKGQHTSFFITDPNGYFIEFKTFFEKEDVFAT